MKVHLQGYRPTLKSDQWTLVVWIDREQLSASQDLWVSTTPPETLGLVIPQGERFSTVLTLELPVAAMILERMIEDGPVTRFINYSYIRDNTRGNT